MKKLIKPVSLIATAALLCSILAGCNGNRTSSASTQTKAKSSISVNISSEPANLNSILTYDLPSINILLAVNEGLTKLDKNNKALPGMAETWDVSDDQKTYTFHLRDTKWSNGTSVTADDFVFAWMTLLNKDSGAANASLFYVIQGAQDYNNGKVPADAVGIKAKDAKTLVVTLTHPASYFPGLCAGGNYLPVNKAFYEKQTDGKNNIYGSDVSHILYNGPWIISKWVHNNQIVLEKNSSYYNPSSVKLDEINLAMVGDAQTAYNMFSTGQLDSTDLTDGDQMKQAQSAGYQVVSVDGGVTTYMEFNVDNTFMKNSNIRKAFSYAIDRKSFVDNILKNGSIAAYCLTNPVVNGLNGSFEKDVAANLSNNSPADAKSYLQKGLQELGITKVPKVTFLIDDRSSIKTQAAVYQQYWKKNLGVDVEVESMSYKAKLQKQYAKDFMITISGWETDYDDPASFLSLFESNDANNSISYSNKAYDELVEKGKNETDPTKHYQYLQQAELVLLNDSPIAPLYYSRTVYAVNSKLKDYNRGALIDMDFDSAYLAQ